MANISSFLDGAYEIGLNYSDLFQTSDLFEEKNLNKVVLTILAISKNYNKLYKTKNKENQLGPSKIKDTNNQDNTVVDKMSFFIDPNINYINKLELNYKENQYKISSKKPSTPPKNVSNNKPPLKLSEKIKNLRQFFDSSPQTNINHDIVTNQNDYDLDKTYIKYNNETPSTKKHRRYSKSIVDMDCFNKEANNNYNNVHKAQSVMFSKLLLDDTNDIENEITIPNIYNKKQSLGNSIKKEVNNDNNEPMPNSLGLSSFMQNNTSDANKDKVLSLEPVAENDNVLLLEKFKKANRKIKQKVKPKQPKNTYKTLKKTTSDVERNLHKLFLDDNFSTTSLAETTVSLTNDESQSDDIINKENNDYNNEETSKDKNNFRMRLDSSSFINNMNNNNTDCSFSSSFKASDINSQFSTVKTVDDIVLENKTIKELEIDLDKLNNSMSPSFSTLLLSNTHSTLDNLDSMHNTKSTLLTDSGMNNNKNNNKALPRKTNLKDISDTSSSEKTDTYNYNYAKRPTHNREKLSMYLADKKVMSQYQIGETIGKGQFGVVNKALDLDSGKILAVKRINLENKDEKETENLMEEIDLLKSLNNERIVTYYGWVKADNVLNIMLEYVENGSLLHTLKCFGPFPEPLVASYIMQVLEGLQYLHSMGVVHCDLKAANILTTKEGSVKLTDFGVSLNLNTKNSDYGKIVAGTPNWMAPEVIMLKGAVKQSDIWSLGCVVIELITGKPPYYNKISMSVLFHIVEDLHPPLPKKISSKLQEFLLLCFKKDPDQRPNADILLYEEWLMEHKINKELIGKLNIMALSKENINNSNKKNIEMDKVLTETIWQTCYSKPMESLVLSPELPTYLLMQNGKTQTVQHNFTECYFTNSVKCKQCATDIRRKAFFCVNCKLICHETCRLSVDSKCFISPDKHNLEKDYKRHTETRVQSSSLENNLYNNSTPIKRMSKKLPDPTETAAPATSYVPKYWRKSLNLESNYNNHNNNYNNQIRKNGHKLTPSLHSMYYQAKNHNMSPVQNKVPKSSNKKKKDECRIS